MTLNGRSSMDFYVNRMGADRWEGALCTEDETAMPTSERLDTALRALDARSRTIVCLYGRDGRFLTIGGGAGRYVVFVSTPDDQFWNLVDHAKNEDPNVVLLNAGGQEGDFPARQIIAQAQTFRAAQTFLRTGELDASLSWER